MSVDRGRSVVPPAESVRAAPWRDRHPPRRLLAIRLQAHGDTVLTLPYLHALRRCLPRAELDFLTRAEVSDIPKQVVLFDHVFEIGGGRDEWRQVASAMALLPQLWRRRYDVVMDLQRNRVSRLVRRLIHPPAWSEFDRYSPLLAGERTRLTIEAVGLGPLRVAADLVLRQPGRGWRKLTAAGWDGTSELVVLNPAGAFPGRNWPLERYREFAERWASRRGPATFLLLGQPKIAPKARWLAESLGTRAINLVGQDTPSEALAMLRHASLVISEDSGLMHMSWVAGTPTIGLFGASRWVWARPHGNYSEAVVACRAGDGICMDGTCRAGPEPCLAALQSAPVVDLALALIERVRGQPRAIYPWDQES